MALQLRAGVPAPRDRRPTAAAGVLAAAAALLLPLLATTPAQAGCDFGSFWSGGCNKTIEKALTPPPPSTWFPPPPPPPACGHLDQRPCTVVERIPSCRDGLTESLRQAKCVATPPGRSPFLSTMGELAAVGANAQASCLADGNRNVAGARAPFDPFRGIAGDIGTQRFKYVMVGFGCAAPKMLEMFAVLGETDSSFFRNIERAFDQKFSTRPCAALPRVDHRLTCAVGAMLVADTIGEVACLAKAWEPMVGAIGSGSRDGALSVKALNGMGEAIFVLMQTALTEYAAAKLAGAAKQAFRRKLVDRRIAKGLTGGRDGGDVLADAKAYGEKINRVFRTISAIMAVKVAAQTLEKLKAIPECGGTIGPGARIDRNVTDAWRGIAKGTEAAVRPGHLYIVNRRGQLLFFRHDRHGNFDVAGRVIGASGWTNFRFLRAARLPSGEGALYAVTPAGDLLYYRHDANGRFTVQGRKIGQGWAGAEHFMVARHGTLYTIGADGSLRLYRHDDGFRFTVAGRRIGGGWRFEQVISGGSNALYGINADGRLRYYFHDDADHWVRANQVIGEGWRFRHVASAGNGELYGVNADGDLLFYRHDADARFVDGSGKPIGVGWGEPGKYGLIVGQH